MAPSCNETEFLRRVMLAETLEEEADACGRRVDPLDESQLRTMTEKEIRAHFAPQSPGASPAKATALTADARGVPLTATTPSPEEFAKWFPGLARSGTQNDHPRLRVVCFCSAGNAEDMYTSEGTGARRAPSPLLDWCRQNGAEVLAVQPPARGTRIKEAPAQSIQQLAADIYKVLAHSLSDPSVPWVVISHSVGCWVAYHVIRLCRQHGCPMPSAWFLSAMPAPDIPDNKRPWKRQATLNEEQFKDECRAWVANTCMYTCRPAPRRTHDECRAWDINEVVFSQGMWDMYQPLLRADFTLFDSYMHDVTGTEGPFTGLPVYSWWGTQDRRVTQQMVQEWRRFTTGPFSCAPVAGNHLWPLSAEPKRVWLQQIVDVLRTLL